ncbi:hypothetical protein A2276_02210 [candidate division WOR-1 bacterium RIFOXYA12_FULL_43_27]|uniref:Rubrerythrin diiron-binding domain-containing protein n=1 Tax=candidate division WOR-1 bacterium RIFOXYC2_FULL_46_14 TaxID=1802587 RepID=A0A1F4U7Y5_UNCSA|nr:MAG: hypothetical protein A2276_02210 [candidate division WOR-1 bacterium RIFOXYA12_FULL_43_27]OGC19467.1 MAG: hypothetical protein A2292_02120 [candidate division WOR-1 bacterium RIFOXYB2_FULL_46_45]OGC30455.1 MAG: hypothetical protein A2232_02120 [candidate division WOR-1 bacterium RIFOXYA2_FULL_46_56]OGC41054.1 MAG: hypothetical protein A2438_02115 [candidate division WOR-1 bacterium RIFOXYC2_FULL_46_14]
MNDLLADAKLAIEMEKKGYAFYAQSAEKSKNGLLKSTLASLAERELVHIEKIKALYQSLTGEKPEGDWLKSVFVPPQKAELLKIILNKLKDRLNRQVETETDSEKIYETAKGLERDGFTFYEKIAKENEDPNVRKFFLGLAEEEKEHFSILDETLKYLNSPGEWFREKERWIVEG